MTYQNTGFIVEKCKSLHIKHNRKIVRCGGEVDQQVPHQVVVAEGLHRIKNCANGVEHTSQGDERDKLPRSMLDEQWQEEYHSPTHYHIYSKADGRNRASAQRLVEDAEDHHHPLQDKYQPTLPTSDHRKRHRRVATRNGEVDEDVVEDVEDILVTCVVQHRVVERRDQKHQKYADAEDRNAHRAQHVAVAVCEAPHRRKGQCKQHDDAHHSVRNGVSNLLAKRWDIEFFCHKKKSFVLIYVYSETSNISC